MKDIHTLTNRFFDGLTTPAIGPTPPWWWHGSSVMAPDASSRSASSGVSARPS